MGEPNEATTDAPPAKKVKPFAAILREQRKGALENELAKELIDLVTAVDFTGKGGTLTLTLTIKPTGGGVLMSDKVVVKSPQPDRDSSFFFLDDDGNLVRTDPNAQQFDGLREVGADGQVKEVAV